MLTITEQELLFHEHLSPTLTRLFKENSKGWGDFKRSDKLVLGGRAAKQRVHTKASQATGARSHSGYPTAQAGEVKEALIYLKRAQMFQMGFDGFALESARKSGALMSPEEFEQKGLFVNVQDDMSRQIFGDGAGRLAVCNGAGSTTKTLVVDHPWFAQATIFLKPGMLIDIYKSDGTKEVDSAEIDTVDSDTQVTLLTDESWSDNSYVRREDTYAASLVPGVGEMMGIMGFCSNADPPGLHSAGLQNLPVATYPMWKATVDTASSPRPFTDDLVWSVLDKDWVDADVLFITRKIRRVWLAYLKNFGNFDLAKSSVKWGKWEGVPFYHDGKIFPMIPDKFIPDGHVLGVNKGDITIFCTDQNAEVTFEQGTAGGYLQKVADKNEFVVEGHIFANAGISNRRLFFKIDKIEEPS